MPPPILPPVGGDPGLSPPSDSPFKFPTPGPLYAPAGVPPLFQAWKDALKVDWWVPPILVGLFFLGVWGALGGAASPVAYVAGPHPFSRHRR